MIDMQKIRRERQRWIALKALDNGRPYPLWEEVIVSCLRGEFPDSTAHEGRLTLDYLADRGLLKLVKHPDGRWQADLTRYGIDIVEYTIDCDPGIARPPAPGAV